MDTALVRIGKRTIIPREQPSTLYLSRNSKTGFSINLPIALTCKPTAACGGVHGYCYGLGGGPIMFPLAIARQVQNYLRFETLAKAPPEMVEREADRIGYLLEYEGATFLRLFGVGDLQPGSVRFINVLAKRWPDLPLWVSTRNVALAKGLVKRPNLHIMLSTDATTKASSWAAMRKMVKRYRGQAFISYVQQSADDAAPSDVVVVFAQHRAGGNRADFTRDHFDPRTCAATVDNGLAHDGACAECRRCFTTEKR